MTTVEEVQALVAKGTVTEVNKDCRYVFVLDPERVDVQQVERLLKGLEQMGIQFVFTFIPLQIFEIKK